MRVRLLLATFLLVAPSLAHAEGVDPVVVVPVRDGVAGKPQPGVIVDLDAKRKAPLPAPIVVQEGSPQGGTTTVRPRFGGGYTVQENGKTTTEVTPNFGGGYRVKSSKNAPTLILPPP